MSAAPRLIAGLAAPLLALSLAGCSNDPVDDAGPKVLSEADADPALLTLDDLGSGYREQAPDEDGATEGDDCLSRAAQAFDEVNGETELEVEFRKAGPAGTLSEVSVLSGISSYAEGDRAETSLDGLETAMRGCTTAEYAQDGTTVRFDISVSDDRTGDGLDQQVNLTLDGDITMGQTVIPLVVELRYFRVANHGGTVSVSLLDAPGQASEVERLVALGVDRFVAATA